MAKGKAKSPGAKSPEPQADASVLVKVAELKNQGNNLFAQKEWAKAIEQYDAAIKLLPGGHSGRSDLLSNKAACLLGLNKVKEAIKECGSALEANPSSVKALRHRAKALEKQGLYKQALADIQAVNKGDSASDESREAERRLRELLAGRRPSLANGGARAAGGAGPSGSGRSSRSPLQLPFAAKVSLHGETRLVQLTAQASYADLTAAVAQKFHNAGPVVMKYVDREGDLVTITSRADVQTALGEALQGMDRRLGFAGIPPVKITLVPVADKSEVPPIPGDELAEVQRALLAQQQQLAAAQAAAAQPPAKQVAQCVPSGEVVEIDDWMVDLIGLIKESINIDPDRHIDHFNEGWSSLQRAVDTTLRSEAAAPHFERAITRFQEVAASGFGNWGGVLVARGTRELDMAALEGKELSAELAASVSRLYAEGEALYKRALEVKPDYCEALLQLADLEMHRAKVAAKLLVKPLPPPPAGEDGSDEAAAKVAQDATNAAMRDGLSKIKAGDVKSASRHVSAAREWYTKALDAGRAADEERKALAAERAASKGEEGEAEAAAAGDQAANGAAAAASSSGAEAAGAADPASLAAHAQVLTGNSLYEWSQLLGAVGDAAWRGVLDEAVGLFRAAGCSEKDIRGALKNHSQVEQLDLGPDPEPEPKAEPEAATPPQEQQQPPEQQQQKQQQKPAPAAKGLPKLERKPKDKAAQ